jgi:ribosome-interacting GTPase 1
MPTNVTPEYRKAEAAFRKTASLEEKVDRLEEMIALLPKHKGTDHLYADLKRRLSKLKTQAESSGRKGGGPALGFSREGAAQVILAGPPSAGKSSILAALTNAAPEVGDYPFTTTQMQPGMVPYEDIQVQLVDSPPITEEYLPTHLLGLVRGADAVLLVADLGADSLLEDLESAVMALAVRQIRLVRGRRPGRPEEVPCRILANKIDAPGATQRLELLREMVDGWREAHPAVEAVHGGQEAQGAHAGAAEAGVAGAGAAIAGAAGGDGNALTDGAAPAQPAEPLEILPISCRDPTSVGRLPGMLFQWLQIVRVYTKAPGEKPDLGRPYTVFAGQTVADICRLIHKDFAESLRFARLWRATPHPITVSPHEPVQDGDILELHL